MSDPIEVNYVPDGDDWQVTVSGRGQRRATKAPGLIAARDRADQLVDELAPETKLRTVVHLLNGDALEFTTAYLNARLAKPSGPGPKPGATITTAKAGLPAPARPEAAAEPKPAKPPELEAAGPGTAGAKPADRESADPDAAATPAESKPSPVPRAKSEPDTVRTPPAPRPDRNDAAKAPAKPGAS
jgi:hypothetical protein